MDDNNQPPPYDPNDQPNQQYNSGNGGVHASKPSLSGSSIKVVVGGVVLLVFAVYMLSSIFGSAPKESGTDLLGADKQKEASQVAKAGDENAGLPPVVLPPPPKAGLEPPPIDDGFTPPPEIPSDEKITEQAGKGIEIPPPPPLPPVAEASTSKLAMNDKDTQARIRSNMLIVDGGKTEAGNSSASAANQSLDKSDPNRAFSNAVIQGTTAEKQMATRLNNLSMTIAQGKIINAVLETAINTQLPGTLRAIVSRDTYAETGRTVLIPKGSRLIGTYNTGILQGQNRVMIVWTRLIRPDGIDIMIGSPAIDGLGRAGIEGNVNNRYMEIFSAAILTTALTLGAAVGTEALLPSDNTTTTTNTDGSQTTNATPAQQAAGDAVDNLTDISKSVVGKLIDIRPTITIDQGTRVNVFVNRDLTFPADSENALFVQ